MARKSRQLRELEVVEELILNNKAIIPCFRCRVAFTIEDVKAKNIENEHLHEKELGGSDDPLNRAFSHKEKPCHALVTHGNGATFAGSSRHKIAKANDPARTEKFKVVKPGPLPPADRPAAIDPGARCRRCGEYGNDCSCRPIPERSSFRQQRRA